MPDSEATSVIKDLVVGSDRNLYAYGNQTLQAGSNPQLYGMSVSPDGTLRWTHAYADPDPTPTAAINILAAAMPDGSSAAIYWNPGELSNPYYHSPKLAKIAIDVQTVTGDLAKTVTGNQGSLREIVENLARITRQVDDVVTEASLSETFAMPLLLSRADDRFAARRRPARHVHDR